MPYSRNKLLHIAMEYGLLLCAYLVLKFFVSTLTLRNMMVFPVLVWVLTVGIPVMMYYLMRRYRDQYCGGLISYGQAWVMGVYMTFFASLPEALIEYVYFQYVDPEFIYNQMQAVSTMLETLPELKDLPEMQQLAQAYRESPIPSAIEMAFQNIYNNCILGAITSVVLAACVRRSKKSQLL